AGLPHLPARQPCGTRPPLWLRSLPRIYHPKTRSQAGFAQTGFLVRLLGGANALPRRHPVPHLARGSTPIQGVLRPTSSVSPPPFGTTRRLRLDSAARPPRSCTTGPSLLTPSDVPAPQPFETT